MLYGDHDYDRGHPHPRPMQNPSFTERHPAGHPSPAPIITLPRPRSSEEVEKYQRQKDDMERDIQRMKERQMREKMDREMEKKENFDLLTKQFPWDKNRGGGAPRGSGSNRRKKFQETDFTPRHQEGYKDKRETDLYLDTLGGPGGGAGRDENTSPGLCDTRGQGQAQGSPRMTPHEMTEYTKKLGAVSEERRMAKQQRRIQDLRHQIDEYQAQSPRQQYHPDFSQPRRPTPKRSLDLENTRGGAGAPIRDDRGKTVTRKTITLSRDDYGEPKIKEHVTGKTPSEFNLEEDTRPYYPWGGQGGGAPIRDREGNVRTMIYGKLDGRETASGEMRRARRRKEVLYNDLKEGEKQQISKREEMDRYLRAPQADVADVLMAGRVGKPRRDAVTGEMAQHHLGNSDVSKIKMNFHSVNTEKPQSEKRALHDDLVRAADERKQARELEKLKEKQESNAHFNNMDRYWGHRGGGAPKHDMIRKKANLTNSLFYPDASPSPAPDLMMNPPTGLGSFLDKSSLPTYQKLYVDGDSRQFAPCSQSPRYVKSTLASSHRNNFDTNPESSFSPTQKHPPPYATGLGIY